MKKIKDCLPEDFLDRFSDRAEECANWENVGMQPWDYISWAIGWKDCISELGQFLEQEVTIFDVDEVLPDIEEVIR